MLFGKHSESLFSLKRISSGSEVLLFTEVGGINEYDILRVDGIYHIYNSGAGSLNHRQAASLSELAGATPASLGLNVSYPTVIFDGGVWHLWAKNGAQAVQHFTCDTPDGTFTLADTLDGTNRDDVFVRKNPINNRYYMSYYARDTLQMHIMWADSPSGPWTDLGATFANHLTAWNKVSQYDTTLAFSNGHVFAFFVGANAAEGIPGPRFAGMCELNPVTMLPLARPMAIWPIKNSFADPVMLENKVFNSWLGADTTKFGYILAADQEPANGRTDADIVRMRMSDGLDIASNTFFNLHGTAAWSANGLVCDTNTGGAYGTPNIQALANFTLTVVFAPAGNHADYGLIFGFGNKTRSTQPYILCNFYGNQVNVKIRGNTGIELNRFSSPTTYAEHTLVVVKNGVTVTTTLDGVAFGTGDLADGAMSGLHEGFMGNWLGSSATALKQFNGTIKSVVMIEN